MQKSHGGCVSEKPLNWELKGQVGNQQDRPYRFYREQQE